MANEKKYNKTTLSKKTVAELADLLEEEGFEADEDWKKADYIEALLEIDTPSDDEEDDEEADEVDDEEEDDEVDDIDEEEVDDLEVDEEPAKKSAAKKSVKKTADPDTLAAKQVATELGVEAKVLRQFFRSPSSTVEAVGSGGRYEFHTSDLPKIKEEFAAWQANKTTRSARGEGTKKPRKGRSAPAGHEEIIEEVEELEIEDLDELDDELED